MKKVYLSILAIVATLSLVGGATYALFSNEATSGPNTFATGNADLKLRHNPTQGWADSYGGSNWDNLYPGWEDSYNVYLKNNSSSPITLRAFPRIESVSGNWMLLDNIYLQFLYADGTPALNSNSNPCGNVTLRWWLDNPDSFDIGDLTQAQERGPWIAKFTIPTTVGNEIANKTITFDLIFNGIQTP